jgi:transglutaminase-like putative cysteine protease
MLIKYGCELTIGVANPTAVTCLVDIHPYRRADIVEELPLSTTAFIRISDEQDAFGNRLRRFVVPPGETTVTLNGMISDSGKLEARDPALPILPVHELPQDVLVYLNGSRYCETDKLGSLAWNTFGSLPRDGTLVQAICDFVNDRMTFDYQLARNTRTALEAYEERVGVCRDFAHLAVALCRCMNIPARYVNGYLGEIGVPNDPAPMDFHAWFEVYIGGLWQTYDPRYNQRRIGRLPIAYGRDATDVPILQTFGPHRLANFKVVTEEVAYPPLALAA